MSDFLNSTVQVLHLGSIGGTQCVWIQLHAFASKATNLQQSHRREYSTVSGASDKSINTKQKQQCNSPSYPVNRTFHLINKWAVCQIIFHLWYKNTASSSVSQINKQCVYSKCSVHVSFHCSQHPGEFFVCAFFLFFYFILKLCLSHLLLPKVFLLSVNV